MSKFEGAKGPMFGRMTEADFPSDTITLEMETGYYTAAMRFAVVPADEYTRLSEQRAELLEALHRIAESGEDSTTGEGHADCLQLARFALAGRDNATQQRNATGGEG